MKNRSFLKQTKLLSNSLTTCYFTFNVVLCYCFAQPWNLRMVWSFLKRNFFIGLLPDQNTRVDSGN